MEQDHWVKDQGEEEAWVKGGVAVECLPTESLVQVGEEINRVQDQEAFASVQAVVQKFPIRQEFHVLP